MMKVSCFCLAAVMVTACAQNAADAPGVVIAPRPHPLPAASLPPAVVAEAGPSLWTSGPNALLSMRRAKAVGDLLTVVVEMNDRASLQSSLSRSRESSENVNVDALLGLPDLAGDLLPGGAGLSPGVDYGRESELNGRGTVNRAERVTFKLAAKVIGVEPNGNLIIQGYQQTQVSNEVRYLTVSGTIRSQDITRTNTVQYEKIADASLAYVSTGEGSGPVKRGGVSKVLDVILPF